MCTIQTSTDDRASEDEIGTLITVVDVTTTASCKPVGLRPLSLCVRFILCLRKTRSSSLRSHVVIVPVESNEVERETKRQRLRQIVKEKDLKALREEFGGVDGAKSLLLSESEGIANDDLELSAGGRRFWHFLLSSLNSYTIFFLLIAAGLSFAIGTLEQGSKHGWHDGAAILVAVFMLVFIPTVANFLHDRKIGEKLLQNKKKLEVSVEINGVCGPVSVSDVKVGNKVHLKKGDSVPADGLLVRGNNLILDEVINPRVDCDQNPFLYSGSIVKHGDGVMIVSSTGADTTFGEGLVNVTTNPFQKTLLQSQMDKPYAFIDNLALFVSLMIAFVVLIRLLCKIHDDYNNDKPETKGKVTMGLMANIFGKVFLRSAGRVSVLANVLVAIVIGIQNGMPFAITASLRFWKEKVGSYEGNSQNLPACGTMGLVSAICIDITGGMLVSKVEADEFWIGKEKINRDVKAETDQAILEFVEQAASVLDFEPRTYVGLMNGLFISWASSGWEMNIQTPIKKFDIIEYKKFSFEKGIGALMSRSGDDEPNVHLHYNGDASTILNMCSQYYDISGRIYDIENQKQFFEKVIKDMANKKLRPIAFACKQTNHQEFEEDGLKLLGFVGLKYSCQEIIKAVEDLTRVGVGIVLTSEDELSVARAMAYDLGIECGSNNSVVEGEEIREIMKGSRKERTQKMDSITVMGKAIPEDKLLLIQGLKDGGHVVAFLGGLTSTDALALREADVGVTLENWSTEICQTVSDLTIVDVGSLTRILRCGRCAYLNIQKFYRIQLTASISWLLITLISTMSSGGSPITSFHLIWVTLIMCLLGGMMMVMELNEEVETIREGNRNQPLITKVVVKKVVMHVLYQALILLLFEHAGQKVLPSMNKDVWRTMIFNTFIFCQIFNLFDAMEVMELVKKGLVFEVVLQRHWFLISLVGIVVVQVAVIEFFGTIVNCVKLSAAQWAICACFASLTLTLQWALNIVSFTFATLSSLVDSMDFHCRFILFASLMFLFSVSFGF